MIFCLGDMFTLLFGSISNLLQVFQYILLNMIST